MKKLLTTVFGFLSFTGVFAQQPVSEATLVYAITVNGADENMSRSFRGATYTVYLKGTESRTEMTSSLGTETSIYSGRLGKGAVLKEYSGQKLMITLSKQNWVEKNRTFHDLHFSTGGSSVRIGQFEAFPAETVLEGKPFTVFYSKTAALPNTSYNNAFGNIKGIPVKFVLGSKNMSFTYTLTSVNFDVIPSSKFEIPNAGYRVMSYDENQKLKTENR